MFPEVNTERGRAHCAAMGLAALLSQHQQTLTSGLQDGNARRSNADEASSRGRNVACLQPPGWCSVCLPSFKGCRIPYTTDVQLLLETLRRSVGGSVWKQKRAFCGASVLVCLLGKLPNALWDPLCNPTHNRTLRFLSFQTKPKT